MNNFKPNLDEGHNFLIQTKTSNSFSSCVVPCSFGFRFSVGMVADFFGSIVVSLGKMLVAQGEPGQPGLLRFVKVWNL